ncbi:OmpH family outer membrane protein [Teredinibacter waterburyi]|jgi:Outer membrane protein|uniref:OmpH family outer membrane protein n=1 Tax=Teredinibacter waterburyi TaxID=1500538 RepID=UPI00165ED736|nr:OmpH family outer membrane protein [Teredinibacter waterburyi]
MLNKIIIAFALSLSAMTAAAGKIAICDPQAAVMQTEYFAKAYEALKARGDYSQMLAQVESLQADMQALAKEAETKGMTWGQEQQLNHRKKVEYVRADLELAVKKVQSENNAFQSKVMQELQPKLEKVMQKIVDSESIDMVLRPQSVFYAAPDTDITAKITAALNKAK